MPSGAASRSPSARVPLERRAILPVALGALGFLLFGYDTGVIAGALLFIRAEMGLTATQQGLVVIGGC